MQSSSLTHLLLLSLIISSVIGLKGIGLNAIKGFHLNKGKQTKYLFSIETQQQILTLGKIKIKFPFEFDHAKIASNLQCMGSSSSYAWKDVQCQYSIDSVIVTLGFIRNQKTYILIRSPVNPSIYQSSSYFTVCLMYDDTQNNCNQQFGKVVFADSPIIGHTNSTYPSINSLGSNKVQQSSTYEFKFTMSTVYSAGNTIRLTLPEGYSTTDSPICQMSGTYNQVIQTFLWPKRLNIQCQNINKTLGTDETLKIIGIYNPNYAATFGGATDSFKLQLLKGTTTIVEQQISLQTSIVIEPGTITGNIVQTNNFIKSESQYLFSLTLQNSLTSQDYIQIEFTSDWILYEDKCSIITGINLADGSALSCKNSTNLTHNYLKITNFQSALISTQIRFKTVLVSPIISGTYAVQIITGNSKGIIDKINLNVALNATYGSLDTLSINAITANSKLPVGKTGPLELTFFLNEELPQTNVLTQGKFLLKILPKLTQPNNLINGQLICYFFNDIPSQSCLWDDTNSDYTLITMKTPEKLNYQYSQIPITITTQGAVNESMIGITISPKVTRYRFQLQAYKHDNATTPTEVYYSEWVADAIAFNVDTKSLTKQVNQQTYLQFKFNNPYYFNKILAEVVRFKVQFLGDGWATALGYNIDQIYKRFPCIFSSVNGSDSEVFCDLYTHTSQSPYSSLTVTTARGPYLIVYGFSQDLLFSADYRLHIGGIKIASSTNVATKIRFSIIEQTPAMLNKYIELYYSEQTIFTTTAQSIVTPLVHQSVLVMDNSRVRSVSNHTHTMTVSQTSVAALFQYDKSSTQSFENAIFPCSLNGLCITLGYPVNWVVEYDNSSAFGKTITSQFSRTNGLYSGTFQGIARVFKSDFITIFKSNFSYEYIPKVISQAAVTNLNVKTIYSEVDVDHQIEFTTVTTIPKNGFIRITFANGVKFGKTAYCAQVDLPALISELDIQCQLENSRQTLKIYNLDALSITKYEVKVRLSITATTGQTAMTISTYYSLQIDDSRVDQLTQKMVSLQVVSSSTTGIHDELQIKQPRQILQSPRAGYIGTFQIKFTASSASASATTIRLTLHNHHWNGGIWKTPNDDDKDALVCLLNHIRVDCTFARNPLSVLMDVNPAGINAGSSNTIMLDTQYISPYNGIKHPDAGEYASTLFFYDSANTVLQNTSFYHRIRPQKLRDLSIESTIDNIATQNMFVVNMRVQTSKYPRANDDPTKYSRVWIQFPTIDSLGNSLFAADLGGYQKTGQYVGCYFQIGLGFLTPSTGNLRCRLIKSQVLGEPARVEIINHQAFSSTSHTLKVYIAKVYNPAQAVLSVPISVHIQQVTVANNNVEELYYETFQTFINSRSSPTPLSNTASCGSSMFNTNFYTNQISYMRFYPYTVASSVGSGYYFVFDVTKDFKPQFAESQYCPSTHHSKCMAFPDINSFIIYAKSDGQQVRMSIRYPQATSQVDTILIAKIWQDGRFIGQRTTTITSTCWSSIRGGFTNFQANLVGSSTNKKKSRKKQLIQVKFQPKTTVPNGGSIAIRFNSRVPYAYAHCRSMLVRGSQLVPQGVSNTGQIGCMVQNNNHWVITSFKTLTAGSTVVITGEIDLPIISGSLSTCYISTFNNTHENNVASNGFMINNQDFDFGNNIHDSLSWNANTERILHQTLPLRTGYIGPLQIKFRLATDLTGPNKGEIIVKVPKKSVVLKIGGFQYKSTRPYVCQIVDIHSHEQTGCTILEVINDDTVSNSENIQFKMITSSNLLATSTYKLVITTQTGTQPEGLHFPTVAGLYKIDFNFDTDESNNFKIHNQLYLDVYGSSFNKLQVTSFISILNHPNLVWIELTPSTTITTTQQLIIQIPTKSSDGSLNLFANDLGLQQDDGSNFLIDIVDGSFSQGFMQCKLYHGDQDNAKPVRIVCGKFTQQILNSQTLIFAFKVINPSTTDQICVPFFVYMYDAGKSYSINFNVVEKGVCYKSKIQTNTRNANITTTTVDVMQKKNQTLNIAIRNNHRFQVGQFYIIMFNFPLRVNGKLTNGAIAASSTIPYGDLYYHQNIWIIAMKITRGFEPNHVSHFNIRLQGFYTPWYTLSSDEQDIRAYACHFTRHQLLTTYSDLPDGFPIGNQQLSQYLTSVKFDITPVHQVVRYKGSRDDFILDVKLSNQALEDLSYAKTIVFIFYSNTQTIIGSDCMQAPGSQIEVKDCRMVPGTRNIFVRPVVKKTYTNNMKLSIMTREFGVRNSYHDYSVGNFRIKYYATDPSTLSPQSNNTDCFMMQINAASTSVYSFTQNPSGTSNYPSFPYFRFPHQRFFKEIPFNIINHRAPFSFYLVPSITFHSLSDSSTHRIRLTYFEAFKDSDMSKIKDLQTLKPICYLSDQRIRSCTIDTTNNYIQMHFKFGITKDNRIHVLFALLDPRSADVFGFLPRQALSSVIIEYQKSGDSTVYYLQTDQFVTLMTMPSGGGEGPFRAFQNGKAEYGHTGQSQLNYVNLEMTFNRTDIRALVFEIPMFDILNQQLYSTSSKFNEAFFSLENGAEYPCGNNGFGVGGKVKCLFYKGNNNKAGTPTRIIMTGFSAAGKMNCRFVFKNPQTVDSLFGVNIKAFGGGINSNNLYGDKFYGQWEFPEIFKTTTVTKQIHSYNIPSTRIPTKSPWQNGTTYYIFSQHKTLNSGRSCIAQVLLYDSSSSKQDKMFGQATLQSTDDNQDLLQYTYILGTTIKKYAFYIRKYGASVTLSTNSAIGWGIEGLKLKYYVGIPIIGHFFFTDNSIQVATTNYSPTLLSNLYTSISAPEYKYYDSNNRISDGTDTLFVNEIDLTSTMNYLSNFQFRVGDDMVMSFTYDTQYWQTPIISCSALGGFLQTSNHQRPLCYFTSDGKTIYIRHIGGFENDQRVSASSTDKIIKFVWLATKITKLACANAKVIVSLYANFDAYKSDLGAIFSKQITLYDNCYNPKIDSTTFYSHDYGNIGLFQLLKLTDTSIQVRFKPQTNIVFGTSTSFNHYFKLNFYGFDFDTCSISKVIMEMTSGTTQNSGTENTIGFDQQLCEEKVITLFLTTDTTWASIWNNKGPANDNTWASTQSIILTITIKSNPIIPVLNHEYIFVVGSYSTSASDLRIHGNSPLSTLNLASAAKISTISNNREGPTELVFELTQLNVVIGSKSNNYHILAQFNGGSTWVDNADPFRSYVNQNLVNQPIQCKCSISLQKSLNSESSGNCYRRLPSSPFNSFAITIDFEVSLKSDLRCHFPQFKIAQSMSFSVEFKRIESQSYPPDITSSKQYGSIYRSLSNTLSYSGQNPSFSILSMTIQQQTDLYANSVTIDQIKTGSTYKLTLTFNITLTEPYIYINFQKAGLIPSSSFCSNNNFEQCRFYNTYLNLIVAKISTGSRSSFVFQTNNVNIVYPKEVYSNSDSQLYKTWIIVGSGTWRSKNFITRSQSKLQPHSDNFQVFSDIYGSNRSYYETNLIMNFKIPLKSLEVFSKTGSKIQISFSGISDYEGYCSVWVQNQPEVKLKCQVDSNKLSITSEYYSFASINNIFVSLGITNPSVTTINFHMKMFSYYYSSSKNAIVYENTATYTVDNSYTTKTKLDKSTVLVKPFYAHISAINNAPIRFQFKVSSELPSTTGFIKVTNAQFAYSSVYLIKLIQYANFRNMNQDTESSVFILNQYSNSGSSLTINLPQTKTLGIAQYFQLQIMPMGISSSGCSGGCASQAGFRQSNFQEINIIAYSSSTTIVNQQRNKLYAYEGDNKINLQSIYVLSKEPGQSSFLVTFKLSFNSTIEYPNHYIEIILWDLPLTAFNGKTHYDIFQCQLSSNFLAITSRSSAPQCRLGYHDQMHQILKVRIENIGAIYEGTYWISLDDIILPPQSSSDKAGKFDISIGFYGPSNLKYENFFRQIFLIDGTNSTSASALTISFPNPAQKSYGASIAAQLPMNWPFDSRLSDQQSKISIRLNKGFATTWSDPSTITFSDSLAGIYELLWVNKKLNKFIFSIPKKNKNSPQNLKINGLINPYPYQKQQYNDNQKIFINFYHNYYHHSTKTISQPDFNIFEKSVIPLIKINQFQSNKIDIYPSNNSFGTNALVKLRLSLVFNELISNIVNRKLNTIDIQFTSGVKYIQRCLVFRNNSLYANQLLICQFYKDSSSKWHLVLHDIMNSQINIEWQLHVFASFTSNSLTYITRAKATNDEIEYQSSLSVTVNSFTSSRNIPITLDWLNNIYTPYFYENQVRFIQADHTGRTPYFRIQITSPQSFQSVPNDTIKITLNGNAIDEFLNTVNTDDALVGLVFPVLGPYQYGTPFYVYTILQSSNTYIMTFSAQGEVIAGNRYMLHIQQPNVVSTSFYGPKQPQMYELQFVYISSSGVSVQDSTYVKCYKFFKQVQILHTTTTVNDYDTLTVKYKPNGNFAIGSSSHEVILRLDVSHKYHENDGGLKDIYTADGRTADSGVRYSAVVSNSNGNQGSTVQFGQPLHFMTPLRFTLVKQNAYADNNEYTWRIPLLKNPGSSFVALRYNLTLVEINSSQTLETVQNHYESINQYHTVSNTSTKFDGSIINTRKSVQISNVDLGINLDGNSLDQQDVIIAKLDNSLKGLDFSFISGSDTTNYNYYYFDYLNIIMAEKKSLTTINSVDIGSTYPSALYQTNFNFKWIKICNTSNTIDTNKIPYTMKHSNPTSITLDYLTTVASTLTKEQGQVSSGSMSMYKLVVTVPKIPAKGQIKIQFDKNLFTSPQIPHCRVGINLQKSNDDNEILRCYRTNENFRITGFKQITSSKSIIIYFYLKSKNTNTISSNISIDIVAIYNQNNNHIVKTTIDSINQIISTFPSILKYQQKIIQHYYQSQYYQIQGSFKTIRNTLSSNDLIYITQDSDIFTGTRRLLIKKNTSAIVGWVELIKTQVSATQFKFTIPAQYTNSVNVSPNQEYIFRYSSYGTTSRDAYLNPSQRPFKLLIRFDPDASTSTSFGDTDYEEIIAQPIPKQLTIINRNPSKGQQTMLDLQFTTDITTSTSDTFEFLFDTNNLRHDMFEDDVEGIGITSGQTQRYMDCKEWSNTHYISNNKIQCLLIFGSKLASPPKPARLLIQNLKANSPRTYRIQIANVKNPTTANMNVGITVKINQLCSTINQNLCTIYQATGYYVTSNDTPQVQSTASSFTVISGKDNVLETNLEHTLTLVLTSPITTADAIFIVYPMNYQGVMSSDCLLDNTHCDIFPNKRWIMLYPTSTLSSNTLVLKQMNNPYYSQGESQYIKVTICRSGNPPQVYQIQHSLFNPVQANSLSTPISMTIEPSQNSDNIYLRNYANIVIIKLKNLYYDAKVKVFYIIAPSDVQKWQKDYCNVTLTDTIIKTYPLRFICSVLQTNEKILQILPDTEFNPYQSNWNTLDIKVHAKIKIGNFTTPPVLYVSGPITSGQFHAYGSINQTSESNIYYLSHCKTTIQISQHQIPIISDISFNQKSFRYRVARVNDKQVFYLLLNPTLNTTIHRMQFTIPYEFDYPGVFSHDNCFMIGRTKEQQPDCTQRRQAASTKITIIPKNYDNDVKIIQLGSHSEDNWFTAPSLPGNFYNMTVQLYGDNNLLLEKQTIDISPIFGQYFDIPSISIANIQDKDILSSIYDLQFVTGSLQIPPGATTTSTTLTSELQFIFQNNNVGDTTNVFQNDLKTGLVEGSEIGCIIYQGLQALQNKRLKCLLHLGTNSTDKPIIKVINYNFIDPKTVIKISIAGIQSLPANKVTPISIGVLLNYNTQQSSTYLYIPTAKLPVPTKSIVKYDQKNSNWHSDFKITAAYSGVNIVLQPTSFSVTITSPYSSPHLYTYKSTGVLDEFILIKFVPKFIIDPNNPVQIACFLCTEQEIFYAAGIIRLRHRSTFTGASSLTFQIFPTSAYSVTDEPISVEIQIYQDYQAIQRETVANISRTVQKCSLFDFGTLSVSSLSGGEVEVTYTFSIITNHFIPGDGVLSVTIPISYGDLIKNNAKCKLTGFENSNTYCSINTQSSIDIFLNGSQLSQKSTYLLQVTGMQNPNSDISSEIFFVTSYYDNNVYLSHKICQKSITPPTINIKAIRACTLEWKPDYRNANYNASYLFLLSCSDLFRSSSILYIELPTAYNSKNTQGYITCTSYETTTLVEEKCQLKYVNGTFMLVTQLQATTQSSLSIITPFVSPINNTYQAKARIISKGILYAQTPYADNIILSSKYISATSQKVFLMNSPKQAGLMATYIFKITPVIFNPSNLAVTFPDNFFLDAKDITIGLVINIRDNLFINLTYNNVQKVLNNVSTNSNITIKAYPTFEVKFNTIFIKSISTYLEKDKWTYVFIRGINNPSRFERKDFKIAYYVETQGNVLLQWLYHHPLTYFISAPPKYLSLQSVSVSDYDLYYPSVYTFNLTGENGNHIAIANVQLSYIVVMPSFFKSTNKVSNTLVCKFEQLSTTSSCESYQSQITITETFTANFSKLTLTIDHILNPALQTYCDTTDISLLEHTFFRIRVISVKTNTFLYESSSIVDNNNCLKFKSIRIPITLQYPLVMVAGLAYNITYGLTKPAANLKLTASIVSGIGFTFVPSIVEFNDYYILSKSTQLYLRSNVAVGKYIITFTKQQSEIQTYFRNILPIEIMVIQASTNTIKPTIKIPSISQSTIGYPIIIPIQFSLPSSTQMTLFITIQQQSNQTLQQYSSYFNNFSISPKIIQIQPQKSQFNFNITHYRQNVPPKLTLNFKLTSLYPIIHQLTNSKMYLCFDRDPTFNVLYPPLRISLTSFDTSSACLNKDVGKPITNIFVNSEIKDSSTSNLNPEILSIKIISTYSTSATVQVHIGSHSKVYYLCLEIGYPSITNTAMIKAMNNTNGFVGVINSTVQNIYSGTISQLNYKAIINITKLNSLTDYKFYAIAVSNLGESTIKTNIFKTKQLSKGILMKLSFNNIISSLDIVKALNKILRISPLRIKILTSNNQLQKLKKSITNYSNKPKYIYQIVIAPDANNDYSSPQELVINFINNKSDKILLKSQLSQWNQNQYIKYQQLRPVQPKILNMLEPKIIYLYNATFTINLWQKTNIYAIIIQELNLAQDSLQIVNKNITAKRVGSLSQTEQTLSPSSNQIRLGMNHKNIKLNSEKHFISTTDKLGKGVIFFKDLKPGSKYYLYVTCSSILPYQPTYLWNNSDVIKLPFETLHNPNLYNSELNLDELSQYRPGLATAIKNFKNNNYYKSR